MNDIRKLVLIYQDKAGNFYEQLATDLVESGTLINPETDEDMDLVGWRIIE